MPRQLRQLGRFKILDRATSTVHGALPSQKERFWCLFSLDLVLIVAQKVCLGSISWLKNTAVPPHLQNCPSSTTTFGDAASLALSFYYLVERIIVKVIMVVGAYPKIVI